MQQLTTLRSLFKFHSGRVIALGRVMLAITIVLIAMFGRGQPEPTQTYPFLVAYVAGAVLIAVVTWKNCPCRLYGGSPFQMSSTMLIDSRKMAFRSFL